MNAFYWSSLVTNEHNIYYPYSFLGVKIIQTRKPHLGSVCVWNTDHAFKIFSCLKSVFKDLQEEDDSS